MTMKFREHKLGYVLFPTHGASNLMLIINTPSSGGYIPSLEQFGSGSSYSAIEVRYLGWRWLLG